MKAGPRKPSSSSVTVAAGGGEEEATVGAGLLVGRAVGSALGAGLASLGAALGTKLTAALGAGLGGAVRLERKSEHGRRQQRLIESTGKKNNVVCSLQNDPVSWRARWRHSNP